MGITLIRTAILYFVVIISVRLMGKRQIGQLQPSELVVTILLSNVCSLPIENNDISLIPPLLCVSLLVALEILSSYVALKSSFFRRITQGSPMFIIKKGVVDVKQMKKLRFTVEDLMEALRQKDVFDLSEVEYAIVETNGTLSVLKKANKLTICPEDLNISVQDNSMPCVVISDGAMVESNFEYCDMNKKKLENILLEKNMKINDILIMTYDIGGNTVIVEKEKKE